MADVLVVDDDPVLQALYRAVLERAGHSVTSCGDGAAAVEHVQQNRPDVVVIDRNLPRMSGLDAVRVIRATGPGATRIVMATGALLESEVLDAWRAGADAYVAKPFMPEVLLEAVDRVLSLDTGALEDQRRSEIRRCARGVASASATGELGRQYNGSPSGS